MSAAWFCLTLRMSPLLFAWWCEFFFSQEMFEIKIIQHSNFLWNAHLQRRENTCFKAAYLKSSKFELCKHVLQNLRVLKVGLRIHYNSHYCNVRNLPKVQHKLKRHKTHNEVSEAHWSSSTKCKHCCQSVVVNRGCWFDDSWRQKVPFGLDLV